MKENLINYALYKHQYVNSCIHINTFKNRHIFLIIKVYIILIKLLKINIIKCILKFFPKFNTTCNHFYSNF